VGKSSSKAAGTRRTSVAATFFTAFFIFFRLSPARLVAAWSSASETPSDDICLRLLDSRDLVFSGHTVIEGVQSSHPFLFFEDGLLDVFGGSDEHLATAFLISGRRERKDLSPQTLEKTRLILFLCFTKFLKACYSFIVHSPIMAFTFFSISSMKSSALRSSGSWMSNRGKGTSWAAQSTLKNKI
jgi:hypothetical protein